jgi:hypothetical protein
LFSLILALFLVIGCIESVKNTSNKPLHSLSNSRLEVDFVPEVADDLFSLEGDLVLWGNASLPYLMMDASLWTSSRRIDGIRYMMVDVKPCEDRHFEISKNRKVSSGVYNLTLEISGPYGLIKSETRRCQSTASGMDSAPSQIQYIFVSTGEQEPSILSDEAMKDYLAMPEVMNASNATSSSENIISLQSSLGEAGKGLSLAGDLVGSTSSNRYHRPDCRYAIKIKPENRVYFANAEEAERQGYLPCKTCNP